MATSNLDGSSSSDIVPPQAIEAIAKEAGVNKDITKKVVSIAFAEHFSGPIPHPRIMAAYKEIQEDAPDRIIKMAELQQQHRMGLERVVITGDVRRADVGLYLGFILFFGLGGGSLYLMSIGKDLQGYITLGTVLVGGIANFIRVGIERAKQTPPQPRQQNQTRQRHKKKK